MHKALFWDVDTQYDFMMPDGRLCIPGAAALLQNLARLTRVARARKDAVRILASMDDHDPADAEIAEPADFLNTFPPHCLHGSIGQMKVISTEPENPLYISVEPMTETDLRQQLETHEGEIVILKRRFDVFTNPNTEPIVRWLNPSSIYLYGVALDVCDAYAMEGLLRCGQNNLFLVSDAAAAIDPERGRLLVEKWRSQGVSIVSTAEVCLQFAGG